MKNRSWINYAVIAVLLAALFFFAYYKPKMSVLSSLTRDRVKVEDDVRRLRLKKMQMDKIEKEMAIMAAQLKELEAIIPEQKEISNIMSQSQQLAYDTRLNITKFTPKGESFREFYLEWPIQFEIQGSYHNLGLFFDRLSRFSRLFTIERFQIKALTKQSETATVGANFTAKTYVFLDEENLKALQDKAKAKGKKAPTKLGKAQPASKTGGTKAG